MYLLQAVVQQTSVTDVTFRMMDVIYIILGTATVVGTYFAGKNAISKIEDRITSEVDKGKTEYKHLEEKHTELSSRVAEVENSLDSIEDVLGKKIDVVSEKISTVKDSVASMKTEIFEYLLGKKQDKHD